MANVKITISVDGHPDRGVICNDAALEAIRFNFNPGLSDDVTALKAIAAAFLSRCDEIERRQLWSSREFAVAKINMQTASMWAVLAATKDYDHSTGERSA